MENNGSIVNAYSVQCTLQGTCKDKVKIGPCFLEAQGELLLQNKGSELESFCKGLWDAS